MGLCGQARAQSAGAALDVQQSFNVSGVQLLRLRTVTVDSEPIHLSAQDLADAPALVRVRGDASRIYRVEIAGPRDLADARLQIWSANAGDITISRTGAMDAHGMDLLRVTGDARALRRVFGADGRLAMGIAYE